MTGTKAKKKDGTDFNIEYVAKLANLHLSDEESALFSKQLQGILSYIAKLEKADTSKTEPIGHITGLENITREDEASPSISQKEALKSAPKVHNGFFEVDAIFEEQ